MLIEIRTPTGCYLDPQHVSDAVLAAVKPLLHVPIFDAPASSYVDRVQVDVVEAPTEPGVQIGSRTSGTSRSAALLAKPSSGSARGRVLAAVLTENDGRGMTDPEIVQHTGLDPNSERPRRVELVHGGWLEHSGRTRMHKRREHAVWQPTAKALMHGGVIR